MIDRMETLDNTNTIVVDLMQTCTSKPRITFNILEALWQ